MKEYHEEIEKRQEQEIKRKKKGKLKPIIISIITIIFISNRSICIIYNI